MARVGPSRPWLSITSFALGLVGGLGVTLVFRLTTSASNEKHAEDLGDATAHEPSVAPSPSRSAHHHWGQVRAVVMSTLWLRNMTMRNILLKSGRGGGDADSSHVRMLSLPFFNGLLEKDSKLRALYDR